MEMKMAMGHHLGFGLAGCSSFRSFVPKNLL